ncbi:MAG: hypothetical protein JXA01_04870 [Dehalococcoidia bacterium]|nr:hypothetical protein [Dehalococcoidia bacterium]
MAQYERRQIDSFSTWHTGAGVDINRKTGDIFVIHNGGLFQYRLKNNTYTRSPMIAPLKTRLGAACVSVNENTGEIAVAHQYGLNIYQPSASGYKQIVLNVFHDLTARARCDFLRSSGDIYVVSDIDGLFICRKKRDGYSKETIDNFGSWHSYCGLGVNQANGDIFVVTGHMGGGLGPYPVQDTLPASDKWPKGDCLARYRPASGNKYIKMIADWPVGTKGGADIDVNPSTGCVIAIADPTLQIYQPEDDGYVKNTIGAAYSRGEGAAVKVNEKTGEIVEVADSHIRVIDPTNGNEPIDLAMTRSCGVDVTINTGTGEIIMVDNRGLTIYRKSNSAAYLHSAARHLTAIAPDGKTGTE